MSSGRAHLVRRSRRDTLPGPAGALPGFLVGVALGVALVRATLATNGFVDMTARATGDTRGGLDD